MITTTQELCNYITVNFPDQITEERGPVDVAIWFCCIQQAKNLSGYDLKDLALVIQGGLPSFNDEPHSSIQEWVELHNEYCGQAEVEGEEFETIEQLLEEFFNSQN